jgi:hypothetical protein
MAPSRIVAVTGKASSGNRHPTGGRASANAQLGLLGAGKLRLGADLGRVGDRIATVSEDASTGSLMDRGNRGFEAKTASEAHIHLSLPGLWEWLRRGRVGVADDLGHLVDAQR